MSDEAWHGAESDVGYTNHKCRCQLCRDAHAAYMVTYRARSGERGDPPPGTSPLAQYQYYGVRTPEAVEANNERRRRQRQRQRSGQ